RPGREAAAAADAGLEEHPGAVADDADRLPRLEEAPHEGDGVLVGAHLVRVADAPGDHEPVVIVRAGLLDRAVDLERVRLVVVVEGLDLPFTERDELRLRALLLDGVPRLGELDLFDHVGRQKRNSLSLQRARPDGSSSGCETATARAAAARPRCTSWCGASCTACRRVALRPARLRRTSRPRTPGPTSYARARARSGRR